VVPVGAAAEVSQLDHDLGAMLVAGIDQLGHPRHYFVLVGENIAESRGTIPGDQRGTRGHGQRHPGLCAFLVIQAVALFGHTLVGIGRFVRADHETIAQRQVLELVWLKQWIVTGHVPPNCNPGSGTGIVAAGHNFRQYAQLEFQN